MNYPIFQRQFGPQGLFSTQEVRKWHAGFDARRLVEWQHKGYLRRVANGWYLFEDAPRNEHLLRWTANRIYQPSYLSLETALSHYGVIPEGVYAMTSVSSRKTRTVDTPLALCTYRHLKPARFFGYYALRAPTPGGGPTRPVLMAHLEKALLDYCCLHPHLTTVADFVALRFNAPHLRAQLDQPRLRDYLSLMHTKPLARRITTLYHYLDQYA